MAKPRIYSTVLLIVFIVLVLGAQYGDSKKHRTSRRQTSDGKPHVMIGPHHHRHRHHHRRHSHFLPVTELLKSMNENSTLFPDAVVASTSSKNIFHNQREIRTFFSTNGHFGNSSTLSTSVPSEITPTVGKVQAVIGENTNSRIQRLTIGTAEIIGTSTVSNPAQIVSNTSRHWEKGDRMINGSSTDRVASTTTADSSYHGRESILGLEKLFGSTEDSEDYLPSVLMIRKKRSAPEEASTESKKRSLLDIPGPDVSGKPEQSENWFSSNVARKRVKRDRSTEYLENPSGQNYLRDLEDSFAPSALEIRGRQLREIERVDRGTSLSDEPRLDGNASKTEDASREQLVRTKRFGPIESAIKDSYWPDTSVESEDNRIIDSMLTKVKDVRPDEPAERASRDGDPSVEMVERDKRDAGFEIREREPRNDSRRSKRRGGRRKKKRKKKRRKKKKKKHRNRRRDLRIASSPLVARDENGPLIGSDDAADRAEEMNDRDAISPHVERTRRDYEDHFDGKERPAPGRFRRASADVSAGAEERDNDTGRIGEKREGPASRAEHYDNVAENNQGPNGTSQITDKKADRHIRDIEALVEKLLVKVNELPRVCAKREREERNGKDFGSNAEAPTSRPAKRASKVLGGRSVAERPLDFTRCRNSSSKSIPSERPFRSLKKCKASGFGRCERRTRRDKKSRRKWDHWTDWSSCSVTCGRGRQIRWRHCLRNCSTAETEMEEKACQFPACAPAKFLGIFG